MHEHYEKRAANVRLRKGARKLLEFIKKNEIEAVILSNHTHEGIESQLSRLKIKKYFSDILANNKETALLSRNKQERLINFLKTKKIKSTKVIIIGDSPEEVEIGRKAKITTVAITNGFYSTSRLKKAKPDYLISNLEEVIKIIKNFDELEKKEALARLQKIYGASKRKTTDEELHRAGEKAFEELDKKFK